MPSKTELTLIAGQGGGSTMIEALLTLATIPFKREALEWKEIYKTGKRLKEVNPAGHVPALILPGGEIVTESLAMALLIAEWAPDANLAPKPDDKSRARYLRLQTMICATIYPLWTVDDDPKRFAGADAAAQETLRKRTDKRRKELWLILESLVDAGPYALGKQFSTLDVFISVMTRWRPRRAWFEKSAPKLHAIATKVDAHLALQEVWARNYG
ncbi:MAG: glutathione S-transferase family protein [Hyphomonadaceae bacterium]